MQIGLPTDIVQSLREKYEKGSGVELIKMADDIHRLPDGFKGKLDHIDEAGQFHVQWENGAMRALVMGEDNFRITPVTFRTVKYFMPLTADRYERDRFGGGDLDGPESMTACEIIDNLYYIDLALEEYQEEFGDKGVWMCFDGSAELKEKVKSISFEIDVRCNKPWGVACCVVRDDLTDDEERVVEEYIEGSASDGLGEGFESHAILNACKDEIYVHLWQHDGWFLKKEAELFEQEQN